MAVFLRSLTSFTRTARGMSNARLGPRQNGPMVAMVFGKSTQEGQIANALDVL